MSFLRTKHAARSRQSGDLSTQLRLEQLEPRQMLAGDGLVGEYFNGQDLDQPAGTRTDATVNFGNDALGANASGMVTGDDIYSIRWTGWVLVDQAGQWQFTTFTNDGVRLWVDDTQIIDNWTTHTSTRDDGTITLDAGWHPIRLEYFQQAGTSDMRLLFSGPGQSETIIPQSHLCTTLPDTGQPIANAGPDRVVLLSANSVILDGSATDNGSIATYAWTQISGPNTALLAGTDTEDLTASNLVEGVYQFQLMVTDNEANTDTDTVTVNVVPETGGAVITGELKQWHKVTLDFQGPTTSETATNNPFLNYRMDVTFTHADLGEQYVVPGYFAGDGNAANTGAVSGNVWRVHFAPSQIGDWTYTASFRSGTNVAVSTNPLAGSSGGFFDGAGGALSVGATDKTGRDLRGKGRLEYVGERYLQFAGNGEYFLKQGPDAPENLLAYEDFDNTTDVGGRRKSYTAHAGDWNPGDPSWDGGKGTELIGAVNYLASEGLNAFSFLPMNIDGDDKNVFPYISKDAADRTRMDVSKLAQWEIVFEHATQQGFFLHFKTQETENDQLLDGGALGTQRRLYYRELIARFSHHLALNWNLGEENTNTTQQRIDFAQFFYDNDPYNHHIVVHTFPGQKDAVYGPLLGNASKLTGASLQTSNSSFTQVHADTVKWVNNSAAAGKPWAIAVDEPGDAQAALRPDNDAGNSHEDGRKNALWGTLMGGGYGNEWYFGYGYAHSDLTLEDFRSRDDWWDYTRYSLEFFYDNEIPFWRMQNDNSISTASNDYGFYEPGEVYVAYLKNGGTTNIDLAGASGQFEVKWFDPRNGGDLQNGSVITVAGGTSQNVGQAPNTTGQDWVVLVRKPLIVDQGPFGGIPRQVTDGAIIQFEDYDEGGEGKAYHDTTATGFGDHARGGSVDAGPAPGAVGERIGWIDDGEWLEYTVDVTAGTYYATVRYSSIVNNAGTVRLLMGDGPDGANFTELATFDLQSTGGFTQWADLSIPGITLAEADGKVLRVELEGSLFELDYLQFTTAPPTNTPPMVTIDNVTQVVTENPSDGVYQESGGLVIMEMENTTSPLGLWQPQTSYANYTGDGYLQFTGNSTASGPPTSPLEFKFKINQPGLYYLHLRAARDTTNGQPGDHSNDAYVRVEGDYGAGPNAGNTHGDDAPLSMLMSDTKFFGGDANTFSWNSGNRLDPGGETNKRVAVYDFKAGEEYTLVVSGRSKFFSIDRIMFRHASVATGTAQNLANPESSQSGEEEVAERTFEIEATVTDDGRSMSPPALTWTKLSGPGTVTFDNPNAEDVTAEFSVDGNYVLRLTADDGEIITSEDVAVAVQTVVEPLSFNPIDDAYLENNTPFNDGFLKVENASRNRTSYLKFDVSGLDGSEITNATLRVQVNGDAGSGAVTAYLGTHNTWTETTLTNANKPAAGAALDTVSGSHGIGQVLEFDVTEAVTGDGQVTFVLQLASGGNDVWFSSSEGVAPPELLIEAAPVLPDPGDFDTDGDVDGFDFLTWQRGVPTPYNSNDLVDWREHYGVADSAADGFQFLAMQRNYGAPYDASDMTEWRSEYGSAASVSQAVAPSVEEAPTSLATVSAARAPLDEFSWLAQAVRRVEVQEPTDALEPPRVEAGSSIQTPFVTDLLFGKSTTETYEVRIEKLDYREAFDVAIADFDSNLIEESSLGPTASEAQSKSSVK